MAQTDSGAMDTLKSASSQLLKTLGERAVSTVGDKVSGLTDQLEGIADGNPIGKAVTGGGEAAAEGGSATGGALKGALSGIKDKVTGGGGGGGGGGGDATSSTNIIESIDVGVPVTVAYNQWTEFGEFPSFMKKVENVDAEDDTKLQFKAQIFLSHRTWEATIIEQVPDERIVWRSKGEKGHVDGAVTFHELGKNLTRILVVLEYYPQGLFEKTGNLWRAQGRRARAELRHFRRHVMTRTILEPDEVEGWRGVIQDSEVVRSHEEVVEEEEQEQEDQEQQDQEDQEGQEDQQDQDGEYAEDEAPEGEDEETEYEEEPEDEDEYAEDEEPEEDVEDEDVEDEDVEEEPEEDLEDEPEEDVEDEYAEDETGEEPEEAEVDDEDEDVEDEPKKPRRGRRSA